MVKDISNPYRMNYYENKQLQDRENRGIGTGVLFILFSPFFGIFGAIAGAGLGIPSTGFLTAMGLFIVLGVAVIAGGIKEKRERKVHQHD